MKKTLGILLSLMLVITAFAGYAGEATSKKLNVVCTIFPQYDFVRSIAGDKVNLSLLIKPGADSHSYEPSPKDIKELQDSDVFIYVGGPDDHPFETMLESFGDKRPDTLKLVDCVDVLDEEVVEGMEADHDHDHDHAEIKESDIKDRPLSDFEGSFQSVYPYFENGTLDQFIMNNAIENELSFEDMKKDFLARRETLYSSLDISENTVTATTATGVLTADYDYSGFNMIKDDKGDINGAWYGYEIKSSVEGMPKFLVFFDHGIGGEDHHDEDEHHDEDKEHDEDHDHEHEHEHIAHFHLRYGDDSIQALVDMEGWEPSYYDAEANAEEIKEAIMAHGHDHEEDHEIDEHVWTSIDNAENIVKSISKILCEKDPENASFYTENTEKYLIELESLDDQFEDVVKNAKRKTLVFGDRFPFRYFVEEYGLNYFAAFVGCSSETEASAGTVAFLINKVKENNIPVVVKIELSNGQIANTVADGSGAKVIQLHSCHNLSKDDFDNGKTYLSLMKENLEALKEALN